MRKIITSILTAGILAGAAVLANAQSRILDRSFPVRVETNTLAVIWPPLAKFAASNALVRTGSESTFTAAQTFGASGSPVGSVVYGTATLSAGTVIVTNAAFRPTTAVLVQWSAAGGDGHPYATAATSTVTFASSSTNDLTNAVSYIAVTP